MTVVILSDVEEFAGSNDKGPWLKYTLKDGNGQAVGATFSSELGVTAKALIGERVELELKPSNNPKYAPTVTAIRAAVAASQNGDGMSKEEWLLKDRAGDKRACIAIAVSALTHTLKSEPTPEQLQEFTARVLRMAQIFSDAVARERGIDPNAGVPFE